MDTGRGAPSAVEIAKGIHWLGTYSEATGLYCNPYLIVDREQGVLIDPGSVLDFELVLEKVSRILSPDKIAYIVLSHQDPDLASSVTLFERAGFKGEVACHWRCSTIVAYYGIRSPFYIVGEHDDRLVLASGRTLSFIGTPYLHFPGAIVTYDAKERILFSSDLFGAFSSRWSLYAEKGAYLEPMRAFHEHYMPSHEILGPVMELFLMMDIRMIAPQHGSVIRDDVRSYIEELMALECGSYLNPLRKELAGAGGYRGLCDAVLKRLVGVFGVARTAKAFEGSGILLSPEADSIVDFTLTGAELWDRFFEILLARGEPGWLASIEVLVERLVREYGVARPAVYASRTADAQARLDELTRDFRELKARSERLEESLRESQKRLVTDPATGLYNEAFFEQYLISEIGSIPDLEEGPALLVAGLDRMGDLALRLGEGAADETEKTAAYVIRQSLPEGALAFGLGAGEFAVYHPGATDARTALEFAESLRNAVASSRLFIEGATISVGVALIGELARSGTGRGAMYEALRGAAWSRLRAARLTGPNSVRAAPVDGSEEARARILVAEPDSASVDALCDALEDAGYAAASCRDGEELLDRAERERPDGIVAELMLPKLDAFMVRERLLRDSSLASIPFVLLAFKKGEEEIARARALRVDRFLKKPYYLSELTAVVEQELSVRAEGRGKGACEQEPR